MDVDVKVSLRGGHAWEFTCDEDDPIVLGLVSALPGAALDGSLPSDGLVQLESRTGERLFLPRSSLIAVSIARAAIAPAGGGERARPVARAVTPAPFVLVPEFLDPDAADALTAMARAGEAAKSLGGGLAELDLAVLPETVVDGLTACMDDARSRIGAAGDTEDCHLDVRSFLAHAPLEAFAAPEARERDVLFFFFHLPVLDGGLNHAGLVVDDRQAGEAFSGSGRRLDVGANTLLAWPAGGRPGPAALDWHAGASALLVCGVLRKGDGDGRG